MTHPSLRLLMVSQFFESHRGGIEIVAGRLARELAHQQISVTWLSTAIAPPPAPDDVRTIAVTAANLTETMLGFPWPLLGPGAVVRIARAVADADVVMIHDALYLTSIAAFAAARRAGVPIVVVQHIGAVPYRNPLLRGTMTVANRVIARRLLAGADQAVFISESTARHFADVPFRTPPLAIFNGVDTTAFSPARDPDQKAADRRRLGLPPTPVALFVGRFVEKKGLAALARLAAARPDVTFAFAGWGPLDPRGWNLPNVRVHEGLAGAALAPLYRASDVLVLPSVGEGFPLVVQEALACGLPVVCGEDSAGADPRATPLLDGVPVDPDDPAATAARFSDALSRVLAGAADPAGRAGFAAERYAWAGVAARHAEIIRRLGRARPASSPTATIAAA